MLYLAHGNKYQTKIIHCSLGKHVALVIPVSYTASCDLSYVVFSLHVNSVTRHAGCVKNNSSYTLPYDTRHRQGTRQKQKQNKQKNVCWINGFVLVMRQNPNISSQLFCLLQYCFAWMLIHCLQIA